MLDADGEFIGSPMPPLHKLTERKKQILDKKNPIPGPHHPTYLTMIKGAVLALNESKGASKPAILKYLAQHYQLGENLPKINSHLCMALRKALKEGNIEQVVSFAKGHGASGSFKMSAPVAKKTGPSVAKKSSVAKPTSSKAKGVTKKKAASAKVMKPKVARKVVKKPKVKKTIKKKVAKKTVPVGKIQKKKVGVQKKRAATKTKAPRAKKV
ncbi:linker histone H1 and H5 family protein [Teladorsagia circumcincta]|uniref:Linker histone H1 and H5 family protein n=1 Tax=Teladorsagia circumcincta TaxID=45464 RepID=A0A2G9UNB7_TELCI|nr:linker histone H1 and H5 family protein [Teladorsagia circumcincta]